MRLILAAAALTALALPAQAQRLDTRVRNVETLPNGQVTCRGNANRDWVLDHDADGGNPRAIVFHTPVENDPQLEVTLAIPFTPKPGKRNGADGRAMGLQIVPLSGNLPFDVTAGRMYFDGEGAGIDLLVQSNPDRPGATYLTLPMSRREALTDQLVASRWVDFEVIGRGGTVERRYRFDVLRINDVTETLSLIKWSCRGDRAD